MKFQISSQADGVAIEAPSKSLSVNFTEEVTRGLDGMAEVTYTLN